MEDRAPKLEQRRSEVTIEPRKSKGQPQASESTSMMEHFSSNIERQQQRNEILHRRPNRDESALQHRTCKIEDRSSNLEA